MKPSAAINKSLMAVSRPVNPRANPGRAMAKFENTLVIVAGVGLLPAQTGLQPSKIPITTTTTIT